MQYSIHPRLLVPRGPWYQKSSTTELERTGDVDMKTQHCFPTGSEIACTSVISGEKRDYCTLVLRAPCPSESLQWSGCLTSMSKASLPIELSKLRYSFPFSLCTRGTDIFLVPRVQASGRDPSADGIFYIAFGLMNSCSKLSDQAEEET